jgi:hypothetical protein
MPTFDSPPGSQTKDIFSGSASLVYGAELRILKFHYSQGDE